jgi:hypothetical protein
MITFHELAGGSGWVVDVDGHPASFLYYMPQAVLDAARAGGWEVERHRRVLKGSAWVEGAASMWLSYPAHPVGAWCLEGPPMAVEVSRTRRGVLVWPDGGQEFEAGEDDLPDEATRLALEAAGMVWIILK